MFGNDSIINVNLTNNATFNHSFVYAVRVINVATSILTIVFNSVVLHSLRKHQRKLTDVIFQQTLNLGVTDLIAGITLFALYVISFKEIQRNDTALELLIATHAMSQLAVFVNLCVLSVRRWIVLRHVSQPSLRTRQNMSRTLFFTFFPWGLSILFHGVLMFARSKGDQKSSINFFDMLFGTNQSEDIARLAAALASAYLGILLVQIMVCTRSILSLRQAVGSNALSSRQHRAHHEASKHLLLVLMVATITSLPFILMIYIAHTWSGYKFEVFNILFHVLALNSLINPIIYCLPRGTLRNAIKETLTSLWRSVRDRCRTTNVVHPATELATVGENA